jgi:hypothetical protein
MPDSGRLPPLRKLTLQTIAGYRGQQFDMRQWHHLLGSDLARRNHQSGLGVGEHLTCLILQDLQLLHSVDRVCAQLKELPALEELRLVRLYAWPPDKCATMWEELVCGICELKALRSFIACEVELGGAAAGLAAATQLTHCELVGCGVSEAAEAELRAGLPQLSRSRLVVR